jgi:fission process protein 1
MMVPAPEPSRRIGAALGLLPCADVWRDSPLRLLGYVNELGEAFRPLVPAFVRPSYIVSSLYVIVDACDKGARADSLAQAGGYTPERRRAHVAKEAADTLVWQALASVIVPGFTINRIVALAGRACGSSPRLRLVPTVIGLGSIPLIVEPIDEAVHYAMDATVRPPAEDQ